MCILHRINTHGDQLVDEAAEIRDEAAANGTDMSEKDALTSAKTRSDALLG